MSLLSLLDLKHENKILFSPQPPKGVQISERTDLALDVISEISHVSRGFASSGLFSHPAYGPHVFHPVFGVTSSFTVFQGILKISKGIGAYGYASLTGDPKAITQAKIDIGFGASLTGFGLSYLCYRGLSLATMLKHGPQSDTSWINAPTLLGKAAAWAGAIVGNILLIMIYGFVSLIHLRSARSNSQFRAELEASDKPIKLLKEMLNPTAADLPKEQRRGKQLLQDAHVIGTAMLKAKFKEAGVPLLKSDEEYYDMLDDLADKEALKQAALAFKVDLLRQNNERELARITDDKTVELIKKKISTKLSSSKQEALVQKVTSVAKKSYAFNWINIAIAAVLIASLIACFATMGGTHFIGIVFIVAGVATLALDARNLHNAIQNAESRPHDRKTLWVATALAVVCFVVTAGLTAAFPAILTIYPLIFAALTAGGWITASGVVLARSSAVDRKRLMKNPTLEFFKEFAKKEADKKNVKRLYKKLRKKDDSMPELRKVRAMRKAVSKKIVHLKHAETKRKRALKRKLLAYVG